MYKILYTAKFVRLFGKLDRHVQEETLNRIDVFKKNPRHKSLKVHKLKGYLSNYYSFSIDYSNRIIFRKEKDIYYFVSIGSHDIYR